MSLSTRRSNLNLTAGISDDIVGGDEMPAIYMGWFWKGTWEAFVVLVKYVLWWLIPLALFRPFCEWIFDQLQRERDLKLGLTDADRMDGVRFEEWLANFFRARGYGAKTTPRTGDYGVDLVLERDGQTTVVQAKRWKGSVGVTAIQEIYAGKTHYGADAAIVVTNSRFTFEARRLAKSTGVILWDRNTLRAELQKDKQHPTTLRTQPRLGQEPGSSHRSSAGNLTDKVKRKGRAVTSSGRRMWS